LRAAELLREPGLLIVTQQGSSRIRRRRRARDSPGLQGASPESGIEHHDIDETAVAEFAKDTCAALLLSDRHPFRVCAQGGRFAFLPCAFRRGVVVLGAVLVGVVGRLVVVPDRDEGVLLVNGLQIRIAFV
jgi:hypothetical protein